MPQAWMRERLWRIRAKSLPLQRVKIWVFAGQLLLLGGEGYDDGLSERRLPFMRQAGFDEAFEKRVRLVWLALKFRVILAGEKIGVIAQLDQLRERAVR